MKVLLGILFLLFASYSICHSQITSNDTVQLTKLSPEGILLDKGSAEIYRAVAAKLRAGVNITMDQIIKDEEGAKKFEAFANSLAG